MPGGGGGSWTRRSTSTGEERRDDQISLFKRFFKWFLSFQRCNESDAGGRPRRSGLEESVADNAGCAHQPSLLHQVASIPFPSLKDLNVCKRAVMSSEIIFLPKELREGATIDDGHLDKRWQIKQVWQFSGYYCTADSPTNNVQNQQYNNQKIAELGQGLMMEHVLLSAPCLQRKNKRQ